MKLIITMILLCSVALAQWGPGGIPTDWRGYGLEWMESEKFTSAAATSFLEMSTDTLTFALTGASADRDIYFNLEEEDGTKHIFKWDDGASRWAFTNTIVNESNFTTLGAGAGFVSNAGSSRILGMTSSASTGLIYSSSALSLITADPNEDGSGTVQLGETGDNDITLFNSQQRVSICTVDSVHTMGVDGTSFYTVTTADSIRCPSSPVDGDIFEIKFTHASGGFIKGMGKNIDGSAQVAASENDNFFIVYNTDSGEWEIR